LYALFLRREKGSQAAAAAWFQNGYWSWHVVFPWGVVGDDPKHGSAQIKNIRREVIAWAKNVCVVKADQLDAQLVVGQRSLPKWKHLEDK
jgi:hypothetical protein